MAPIKIAFVDFWTGFDPKNNFFTRALEDGIDYEICDAQSGCDVLFFSCFGEESRSIRSKVKVFFTGENVRPHGFSCDYSVSFDFSRVSFRDLRWPLYNLYFDPLFESLPSPRERFCCMVVSNPGNPLRQRFFHALARHRQVDSGGRLLNNVGGPVVDKLDFIKNYRFCIAFENSSYPGYTTEKLMEAKHAGCIPIYWGNPLISRDFNPRSFVNLHDFASIDACIERILEIDSDRGLFESIQSESLLPDGRYGPWSNPKIFVGWLRSLLSNPSPRGGKALRPLTRWYGKWYTGFVNQRAISKYI